MVLYFTGTGNSRHAARRIADLTGDTLVSMNEKIKKNDTSPIHAEGRLVFVVPTYAWRIPRIVEQWIRAAAFPGSNRAWFVMTCGDEIGNAAKYIKALCNAKQFTCMGTARIVMPENYIAMFDVPGPQEAKEIIRNAEPVIEQAARMIADGQAFPSPGNNLADRIKSGPVNHVFYTMGVRTAAFKADDRCNGCGKCVRVCPLNNLSLVDDLPVWGKTCTHCMACIAYCPTEAIEYGKKSVGKPRYHFAAPEDENSESQ